MVKPHKTPKQKTCRNTECKAKFVPSLSFQTWCGTECAVIIARQKRDKDRKAREKDERKASREAKDRVKTRGEYMREAQSAVNAYVRERDAHLGCVSCDKGPDWHGQWHASHYRSVGSSPELRFNMLNIHKACSVCNNHLSGNIGRYKPELERRIGADKVAWLEGFHEPMRYSIQDLQAIKAEYRAKTRELRRVLQN